MSPQNKKIAISTLRWAVGFVVLWEASRLAFGPAASRHFAGTELRGWIRPVLAWPEIVAAILFLVPPTSVIGSYALLVIFGLAALVHVVHGQLDIGVLVVYAAAVLVSLAYKDDVRKGAHER
jgi:hypothetical protein